MTEMYSIDFSKYSLQKFKESLKNREMIPSRVILKEDLEERFQSLKDNGINSLKDIVDALKTKQKIEAFSQKSNLPIDYLTILKREVSSYHPNPKKLSSFPDVDASAITALEKKGIKNTRQLFNEVKINSDINQLSASTGVSVKILEELSSLSDLCRLYGVGPVFARIIYDAGITSVKSFVNHTGETFIALYEKKTNKKADFSENDINFSLEIARALLS